ncbi:MAG: fibronectin type III domain-containing protein, partial [Chloroflexi bacterium]|nr:fibronectin type III domain-containing protein [Chloroflexota bacterium]
PAATHQLLALLGPDGNRQPLPERGNIPLRIRTNILIARITAADGTRHRDYVFVIVRASGPPGASAITSAARSADSALLRWGAPQDPDGPPITGYHVRYIFAGAAGLADFYWTFGGRARNDLETVQVISGLEPGLAYAFQVRAVSGNQIGEWSDAALLGPVD